MSEQHRFDTPNATIVIKGGMPLLDHERILLAVAEVTGLSARAISGQTRFRPVARARWAVAWLLTHELGMSSPQIANILNVDRTGIARMLKKMRPEHLLIAADAKRRLGG